MLLRLNYLYEKLAKKCCELVDIVDDLKETFNFSRREDLPVRVQDVCAATEMSRYLTITQVSSGLKRFNCLICSNLC